MSQRDFVALLPLLITAYGATVLMLIAAFWRRHAAAFVFTLVTLATAFAAVLAVPAYLTRSITPLLAADDFALFFNGLILIGAFAITLLCYDYLRARPQWQGAFYVLLLFAVLGMQVIVCSTHFIAFFLGLEVLSVALYGLIGYARGYRPSLEGAVKYLVLAATASAFLLLGIALVYSETGAMSFAPSLSRHLVWSTSPVLLMGLGLILVAVGFKLAVVPFHMWSPDVYQGAPAPVTALIATGSKAAILVLLLRLTTSAGVFSSRSVWIALAVFAVASMTVGNLLALMQNNVKRLLAYSSIAQMGYMLIPILAAQGIAAPYLAFYLTSYIATTIAAFGVVAVVSSSRAKGDVEELRDYRGLGYSHPVLAVVMALAMLSLTGIPPTAGFFAKFYVFSAAARAGLWWLLIVGVVNSGISAFYYLRVLIALYTRPEEETEPLPGAKPLATIALAFATAVIVFFGVYPEPLLRLSRVVESFLGGPPVF